mmetsp:Transcript_32176/g.59915  ORF Transcript_32176/g.59915 Transcript_32176/m.59915 type:complete len:432 (-) Transcript_32176:341-1636(-)
MLPASSRFMGKRERCYSRSDEREKRRRTYENTPPPSSVSTLTRFGYLNREVPRWLETKTRDFLIKITGTGYISQLSTDSFVKISQWLTVQDLISLSITCKAAGSQWLPPNSKIWWDRLCEIAGLSLPALDEREGRIAFRALLSAAAEVCLWRRDGVAFEGFLPSTRPYVVPENIAGFLEVKPGISGSGSITVLDPSLRFRPTIRQSTRTAAFLPCGPSTLSPACDWNRAGTRWNFKNLMPGVWVISERSLVQRASNGDLRICRHLCLFHQDSRQTALETRWVKGPRHDHYARPISSNSRDACLSECKPVVHAIVGSSSESDLFSLNNNVHGDMQRVDVDTTRPGPVEKSSDVWCATLSSRCRGSNRSRKKRVYGIHLTIGDVPKPPFAWPVVRYGAATWDGVGESLSSSNLGMNPFILFYPRSAPDRIDLT